MAKRNQYPQIPSSLDSDIKSGAFYFCLKTSVWQNFLNQCFENELTQADVVRYISSKISNSGLNPKKFQSELSALSQEYDDLIRNSFAQDQDKVFERWAYKGVTHDNAEKRLEKGYGFSPTDTQSYLNDYDKFSKSYIKIDEKKLFNKLEKNQVYNSREVSKEIKSKHPNVTPAQENGVYDRYKKRLEKKGQEILKLLSSNFGKRNSFFESYARKKTNYGDFSRIINQLYSVAGQEQTDLTMLYQSYLGGRDTVPNEQQMFELWHKLDFKDKPGDRKAAYKEARDQNPNKNLPEEYLEQLYKRYKKQLKRWEDWRNKFITENEGKDKFEEFFRKNLTDQDINHFLYSKQGFIKDSDRDQIVQDNAAYYKSRFNFSEQDEDQVIGDVLFDYGGKLISSRDFLKYSYKKGFGKKAPKAQKKAFYARYKNAQKNYTVGTAPGTGPGTTPFITEQRRRIAAKNLDTINPMAGSRAEYRKAPRIPYYNPSLLPQANKDQYGYAELPSDFQDIILSQPVMGESPSVEYESEGNRRQTQGFLETFLSFRSHATDAYLKENAKKYNINFNGKWIEDVRKKMGITSSKEQQEYYTALYRAQDRLGMSDEELGRQRGDFEAKGLVPKVYDDPASFLDRINPLSSYSREGRELKGEQKRIQEEINLKSAEYDSQKNSGATEQELSILEKVINDFKLNLEEVNERLQKHAQGYREIDTLKDKTKRDRDNLQSIIDEIQSRMNPDGTFNTKSTPSELLGKALATKNDDEFAVNVAKDKGFTEKNKWAKERDLKRNERRERIERKSQEWSEAGRNIGEVVGSYINANITPVASLFNYAGKSLANRGHAKAGKVFSAAGGYTAKASSKVASVTASSGAKLGAALGKCAGYVGIAIQAFAALVSAVKKGYEAIEKQAAKMLSYSKFDSRLAVANLKSRGRQYYRDVAYAKGVSATGVQLIAEREKMQDNLTPFRTAIDNAKNILLTYLAKGFNAFLEFLKPLLPAQKALLKGAFEIGKVCAKIGIAIGKFVALLMPITHVLNFAYKVMAKFGGVEKKENVSQSPLTETERKELLLTSKGREYLLNDGRVKSDSELRALSTSDEFRKKQEKEKEEAKEHIHLTKEEEETYRSIASGGAYGGGNVQAAENYRNRILNNPMRIAEEVVNGKAKNALALAELGDKYYKSQYFGGEALSKAEQRELSQSMTEYMSDEEKANYSALRNDDFNNKHKKEYDLSMKAFSDYYNAVIDPSTFDKEHFSTDYKALGKDVHNLNDLREIIMNSECIAETMKEQIKLIEEGNKERMKITKNTAPKDDGTGDIILDALSSIGNRYSTPNDRSGLKQAEEVERSKQYGRFADATVTQWGRSRR